MIKLVQHLQFSGILIDDKLYWKSQINYLSTQLSRAIIILNKVKFKLSMKSLVLVYNSFFILILHTAVIFGVIHFL